MEGKSDTIMIQRNVSAGKMEMDIEEVKKLIVDMNLEVVTSSTAEEREYQLHYELGYRYAEVGALNEALEQYKKSHSIRVKITGIEGNRDADTASILNRMGEILNKQHKYQGALNYFKKALTLYAYIFGKDAIHHDIANVLTNIGELKRKQCKYEQADSYFQKADKMLENLFGDPSVIGHPDSARNKLLAGDIALDQSKYEIAITHYTEAQLQYSRLDMVDTLSLVIVIAWVRSLCSKGLVYTLNGCHRDAMREYASAKDILKGQWVDKAHPIYAEVFDGVGDVYLRYSNFNQASAYYEEALRIRTTYYGENSNQPAIVESYYRLGQLYTKTFKIEKAMQCYKKAQAINKKLYEDLNNPELGKTHNFFGICFRRQSKFKDALDHHNKAVIVFRDVYGTDNNTYLEISRTLSYIGEIYCELNNYIRARDYEFESLEMNKLLYTNQFQPIIAENFINLGNALLGLGKYEEGLKYYHKAYTFMYHIYSVSADEAGTPHPDLIRIANKLGVAYKHLKKYNNAIEYHTEAMEIACTLYEPEPHPDIAGVFFLIADLKFDQEQVKNALAYYVKAYGQYFKFESSQHFDSPESIKALTVIGRIFHELKELDRAKECFLKVAKIADKIYGEESHICKSVLDIFRAKLHESLGDSETAVALFKRVLTQRRDIYSLNLDQSDIVDVLKELGRIYSKLGMHKESCDHFLNAAQICRNLYLNQPHLELACCYDGVGKAFEKMRNYKEALNYYFKSLVVKKDFHGLDINHKDIADSFTTLGTFFNAKCDYKTGLDYYTKALDMYIDVELYHGMHTFELGCRYDDIGITNGYLKKWKEAHHRLTEALETKEKAFEEEKALCFRDADYDPTDPEETRLILQELQTKYYPSVAKTYAYIGDVYRLDAAGMHRHEQDEKVKVEKFDNAYGSYMTALDGLKVIFGPDKVDPDIASIHSNLGLILQQESMEKKRKNNFSDALNHHLKCLNMRMKLYRVNPNHIDLATAYSNVGRVHSLRKNSDLALRSCNIALERYTKIFGDDDKHKEFADVYENIGLVYFQMTNYKQALNYYLKSLSIRANLYGKFEKFNIELASIYRNLSKVYCKLLNAKASEHYSKLALKIAQSPHYFEKIEDFAMHCNYL